MWRTGSTEQVITESSCVYVRYTKKNKGSQADAVVGLLSYVEKFKILLLTSLAYANFSYETPEL